MENQVLAEPDGTGRRRPDPVKDATFTLAVDSVITALGQRVELKPEAGLPFKMFAYRKEDTMVTLDEDQCVGCGMCVWRCPNENIEMIQTSQAPI